MTCVVKRWHKNERDAIVSKPRTIYLIEKVWRELWNCCSNISLYVLFAMFPYFKSDVVQKKINMVGVPELTLKVNLHMLKVFSIKSLLNFITSTWYGLWTIWRSTEYYPYSFPYDLSVGLRDRFLKNFLTEICRNVKKCFW